MKTIKWFIIALLMLPFAGFAQKVKVAVAANAQFVSQQLAAAFKQQTGIEVELVVASSGKLTAQIEQGAPFNIFLSADMKYPNDLFQKGFTAGKPKVYGYGKLVLWVSSNLKASLSLLQQPVVQKIAIANPALAPYGEAAIEALTKLKLLPAIKAKIVYGESIAQVNQYLLTGATEAAFTAKSVVLDPAQKDKGNWVDIDEKLYTPIAQGVVLLKQSAAKNQAQQFYAFLFGTKARQIFKQYGYQ